MASRFVFTPYSAEFDDATYPELKHVDTGASRRPVLAFDASVNEFGIWTVRAPADWDPSTLTAIIAYIMAAAAAGDVDLDVYVEAISDGDAVDLDAGDSFDAVNSTDNTVVPGVVGRIDMITVTLANHDVSVAGDYIRFKLERDAVSDTAAGDMLVLWCEIRDNA